ncbi:uncharacterized protein LOC113095056 [Carassius auratus]|uniref:Uncharacterized protein LOC113095056 n=1 Tax=Carassius auratus TaxID=7957 RepID=A0A6P6P648_CARAU|nr:uncharacterized protein LOC113095056 [Carassius auratus]
MHSPFCLGRSGSCTLGSGGSPLFSSKSDKRERSMFSHIRGRIRSHCDAFDYWGKGTQVIVTNEVPKAPNVFMMSPCESSPGSLLVGCLATGFAPTESVNFRWMDQRLNSLTNFIQYPTVGTGNKLMKVSHITINETEWNQGEIICEARHPSGNVKETFKIVKSQEPTLSLVLVTTQKSTSVMCVIEDFYPKKIDVQWKVNNTKSMSQVKLERKLNGTGHYTAYSFYEVSSENWDVNTQYTCEVTHRRKLFTVRKNFKAKLSLTMKPPIQKELFANDKIVLQAVVSGDVKNTVQNTSVSCKVKDELVPNGNIKTGNVESSDTSQFKKIYDVTVDTEKWFEGHVVTCTIRDTNNNRDIEQKIRFQKGDGKEPTVTIYKPDNVKDNISHVCEVTSPKLGDVYVMWKVGNESYREGTTSAPTHQKDSASVLSILTMTKEEYNVITCAVIHANMTNRRAPLQVSTSKTKLSLTMKPPIQKELFANDKIVLQAVVSGDVKNTVQVTSVSCKVKDELVPSGKIKTGNVESSDTSQFKKIYDVTVDTEKWFEGHVVTCTIRDTNNNRDIEQKISFQKGDGKEPTVTIYKPDNVKDNISHVCEVTSPKLGDVYVIWKVGNESYREGTTSAPTHQKDSASVLSILTMTKEEYNVITCAVIHANMTNRRAPLQVSTSKTKLSLTMKPPIQKELFANDKIVLQAVVSGDVKNTVQVTSVSCKVKDELVPYGKIKTGNVESSDTSQFKKIYDVTVDTEKWFEGHVVTCTIRDTNNNRDIEQKIRFQKGDGKEPTVTIYKPDNVKDNISHVCEVTSPKLGDVYVMWKVGDESYREGTTSAPTHQKDSASVLSILTMTKEEYNVITCAVIHANMTNRRAPLQVSTSKTKLSLTMKPPIQKELFANDKIVLQAVVSGDVNDTVQVTSVSCKVKDELVPSGNIKTGNVESSDTSQFKKIYDVTVDTEKWFEGHVVTCTIRDTNNNRDIEQKISFQKGDGKEPTVTIYKPDNVKDNISHVCEVTSPKLGDVYVMWKVGNESYREGTTSAPTHQKDSASVLSILTMTKEEYNVITCAVIHANMTNRSSPLQVSTSKTELSLTMKPPIQKELFVNDTIVLQAVVSGDVKDTVQNTSVSCKVKDELVPNGNIKTGNVESSDTSQFKKIYDVTVDTEKWFDGHMVTCTIRDTNNNRDIEQKISFQKGDGKKPTVTIYKPDNITDPLSHVCEVTSPKHSDVYVMWKVGDESYREGTTSAPIHQKDSTSVLSILTMTKEEYEKPSTTITCAVIHAKTEDLRAPLQVSTSKSETPEPDTGFALDCNKDVLEEDEFRSLWSTATSFIFLFLFSLTYSAVLSFFKVKQ